MGRDTWKGHAPGDRYGAAALLFQERSYTLAPNDSTINQMWLTNSPPTFSVQNIPIEFGRARARSDESLYIYVLACSSARAVSWATSRRRPRTTHQGSKKLHKIGYNSLGSKRRGLHTAMMPQP